MPDPLVFAFWEVMQLARQLADQRVNLPLFLIHQVRIDQMLGKKEQIVVTRQHGQFGHDFSLNKVLQRLPKLS
ncbi:hypothetical protein D3C71_1987910 [compost metagenome]